MAFDPQARFFTTIGNYRQDGNDVEHNGEVYRWSKHHEWEKFIDLPRRTNQPFELALKVDGESDRRLLTSSGWQLTSPLPMSLGSLGHMKTGMRLDVTAGCVL